MTYLLQGRFVRAASYTDRLELSPSPHFCRSISPDTTYLNFSIAEGGPVNWRYGDI
jgi:hypothetical protein